MVSITDSRVMKRYTEEVMFMEVLDADTLSKAIKACEEHGDYRVCLVMNRMGDLVRFMNSIKEQGLSDKVSAIESIIHNIGGGTGLIKFKNGSYIEVVTASNVSGIRSRRCDSLLTFGNIPQNILDIIKPIQISDRKPLQSQSDEYDAYEDDEINTELDEFLSSFTII